MVHGVTDGTGQSLCKFLEFLPGRGIAGDIIFIHAVGAHDPPLIVVTAQPDLGDVGKTPVFLHLLGADVAMIVHNGAIGSIFMIKFLCGFGGQQKIFVHKRFQGFSLLSYY